MNGYGAANYGVNIYGQEAYVDASAVISVASSTSSSAERVRLGLTTIEAVSSSSASGKILVSGAVVINGQYKRVFYANCYWCKCGICKRCY